MADYPGFIGPSDPARSSNYNTERTINLYLERGRAGTTPKSGGALYGTPGLRIFATLNASAASVRGLFAQDQRAWAVAGDGLFELFATGTFIRRGTVTDDGQPATMCMNGRQGHQLFIVSGRHGYILDLDSDAFTQITDPDFPAYALIGAFVDGYFLVLNGDDNTFQISALEDGLAWDGLDIAMVSTSSDRVVSLAVSHRQVWLFGTKTTQVWYNSGNADFPFEPIAGVFIESGILAPWSVAPIADTLIWLGWDVHGSGLVLQANGYTPTAVSATAVPEVLRHYRSLQAETELSDVIAWTYQEDGHAFYALYLPQGPLTGSGVDHTSWVYDVTEQRWHERALDTTPSAPAPTWAPELPRCHAFMWGKHLVGDRTHGTVYHQSLDFYDLEVSA
jgi:hypothetical protein